MIEQMVGASYGEVQRLRKRILKLSGSLFDWHKTVILDGIDDEPLIAAYHDLDNIADELDDWLYEADRERWLEERKLIHWKEWARGELGIGNQEDGGVLS
jgi:hypothetical protein